LGAKYNKKYIGKNPYISDKIKRHAYGKKNATGDLHS
jgi:hypothetical protein